MDFSSLGGAGLEVLKFLLPVVTSVLILVIAAYAKKGVDKMGLERSKSVDEMIDKYVEIGVNSAARIANKKIGGRELDKKDTMALAVSTVLGELEQSGLKGIGEELIKARIENSLEIKRPSKPSGKSETQQT